MADAYVGSLSAYVAGVRGPIASTAARPQRRHAP